MICLHGYTESAATAILLPNSRWSTPVQQYSDDGLKKMIIAYDAKQDGTWDPTVARRKRRKRATPHCQDTPEIQEIKETPKLGYGGSTESEHLNDDDGLKSATPEAEPGSPSV